MTKTNENKPEAKVQLKDFAFWTSLNLASCIDFLRSIMQQHGDLCGDYEPISGIIGYLEDNIRYAEKMRELK